MVEGVVYDTNARTIYEGFCKELGWDYSLASKFGWQKPMYAHNADAERQRGVWFISKYDYNVSDGERSASNIIYNQGNSIAEYVDAKWEQSMPMEIGYERIIFIKTKMGYKYYGLFKVIQNEKVEAFEVGFSNGKTQYHREYVRV